MALFLHAPAEDAALKTSLLLGMQNTEPAAAGDGEGVSRAVFCATQNTLTAAAVEMHWCALGQAGSPTLLNRPCNRILLASNISKCFFTTILAQAKGAHRTSAVNLVASSITRTAPSQKAHSCCLHGCTLQRRSVHRPQMINKAMNNAGARPWVWNEVILTPEMPRQAISAQWCPCHPFDQEAGGSPRGALWLQAPCMPALCPNPPSLHSSQRARRAQGEAWLLSAFHREGALQGPQKNAKPHS